MAKHDFQAPRTRRERYSALVSGKRMDEFERDRHCSYPSCEAKLSRYNPQETCTSHGGWEDAPRRRNRRTPDTASG